MDLSAQSGTLHFAKASHLSKEASPFFEDDVVRSEYEVTGGEELRVGDVTFHSGWTIHGAGANQSHSVREAVAVCFVARGAKVYSQTQRKKFEVCDLACKQSAL